VKFFKKKHIIIILLSVFIFSSCRTKKTFNGTSTLPCADYDVNVSDNNSDKKTKWRLVLYKDGKKVGGKSKRGKSRLFKNNP
jgi:hypothetical protein